MFDPTKPVQTRDGRKARMTLSRRGLLDTDINAFKEYCDMADEYQRRSRCDCPHAFATLSAAALAIKREFQEMQRALARLAKKHPEIFRNLMDEEGGG
jgi:hypothetical protein